MAESFSMDERYDETGKQLKEKLESLYGGNRKMYDDMMASGNAAYEAIKNEARVNKALTDMAGGPASASTTHRQRSENALRNVVGDADRQRQRFAANVDLALKNLETQYAADQTSAAATNAAQRSAMQVNRGMFDAELGIQRQQLGLGRDELGLQKQQLGLQRQELDLDRQHLDLGRQQLDQSKQGGTFDQMMKLYSKGLVDKNQFKALTGYDVKAWPKAKKRVVQPNIINVGHDFKGTPPKGYKMRGVYDEKTKEWTFYQVRDEYLKSLDEGGVSLYDSNRRIKSEGDLYAEMNYDGYKDADDGGKLAILTGQKDDFVQRYGNDYYNLMTQHLTTMSTTGQYYDAGDRAAVDIALNGIFNAAAYGEDIKSAVDTYIAAVTDAEKNVYAQYSGTPNWETAQAIIPEIGALFEYDESDAEDIKRKELGLAPQSLTNEELIKIIMAQTLDNTGDPLKGMKQRDLIKDIQPVMHQLDPMSLLAVWAYIESYSGAGDTADRKMQEIIETGKQLYEGLRDGVDIAAITTAAAIDDMYDSQETIDLKEKLEAQGRDWEDLPLSVQARHAQQKIENYQDKANYYLNYDFDAAQKNIADIQAKIDTAENEKADIEFILYTQSGTPEAADAQTRYKEVENKISGLQAEKETINAEIKMAEKVREEHDIISREDYEIYSQSGAEIQPPTVKDVMFGGDVTNVVAYTRYLNSDTVMDELLDPEAGGGSGDLLEWIETQRSIYEKYTYMTDDEMGVYNYLFAKEGAKGADAYLGRIEEVLNYRQGMAEAALLEGMPVAQFLYSGIAGLDSFGSGVRQLFSSDRLPTTATQFTSSAIYEDLGRDNANPDDMSFGQIMYSVGTGLGNMAPSILLTAVTGGLGAPTAVASGVGAAAMGLSAKGNAYNWALGQGYTKEQAGTYSTLIGITEGGLQYALGGVSKLGGRLTGNLAKTAILKIDSALLRIAAEIPIRMGGEFVEEYLQAALEPVIRNIAFDENNEVKLFSAEYAYQGLIGAVTAGLLEAGPTVARNISNGQAGRGVIQSGKYYDLIDNALTLDPKTEAYKLAKGMQDGSLHANSYNIGGLMKAYVETNGNAAFMYDMPQAKGSSVNTAEQYVEKLAGLNQNAKASAEVADTISSFVTAMQDMGDAIPAEVHDTIMAAYRTFEAGGTNNNAFTVMQTALQSIDSAIGTQLVSGGDVTGLLALRSRMESGLGGTVRGKSAVNTKAMADAVDMLMRLPADVQAAIDVDALSKAYFDYLTAGKADKAAAQGKAVDLLFDSAQAAIATGKLDAATMQKLEGLMAEIDSKRGVGDNRINKRSMPTTPQEFNQYVGKIGTRTDLSNEQKVKLLHEAYYALGNGNRADVRCPADAKYLKGFDVKGRPIYDWPAYMGYSRVNSIKEGDALPLYYDRTGPLYGNNVSDFPSVRNPYTIEEKSLPDLYNPEAQHKLAVRQEMYYGVINALMSNDFNGLNRLLKSNRTSVINRSLFQKLYAAYNNYIIKMQYEIGNIDATYGVKGIVAPWENSITHEVYLKGGATQFTIPLSISYLIRLGVLKEV